MTDSPEWVPKIGLQWPERTAQLCLQHNEWIVTYALWSKTRPAHFFNNIMTENRFTDDGQANAFSKEERDKMYLSTLSPEGLAHEQAFPEIFPSKWGTIALRDGLEDDVLERLREVWQRRYEWAQSADKLSRRAVSLTREYNIVPVEILAKLPKAGRGNRVLDILNEHHEQVLERVYDTLVTELTAAVLRAHSKILPGFKLTRMGVWEQL